MTGVYEASGVDEAPAPGPPRVELRARTWSRAPGRVGWGPPQDDRGQVETRSWT